MLCEAYGKALQAKFGGSEIRLGSARLDLLNGQFPNLRLVARTRLRSRRTCRRDRRATTLDDREPGSIGRGAERFGVVLFTVGRQPGNSPGNAGRTRRVSHRAVTRAHRTLDIRGFPIAAKATTLDVRSQNRSAVPLRRLDGRPRTRGERVANDERSSIGRPRARSRGFRVRRAEGQLWVDSGHPPKCSSRLIEGSEHEDRLAPRPVKIPVTKHSWARPGGANPGRPHLAAEAGRDHVR